MHLHHFHSLARLWALLLVLASTCIAQASDISIESPHDGATITSSTWERPHGSARSASGVSEVQVILQRAAGDGWLSWNGSGWVAKTTLLPSSYNSAARQWEWSRDVELPSGDLLPNGDYQLQAITRGSNGSALSRAKSGFEVRRAAASTSGLVPMAAAANSVISWGGQGTGQLGDGVDNGGYAPFVSPRLASKLAGMSFSKVLAGTGMGLGLTTGGRVYTWGYSNNGSLGREGDPLLPEVVGGAMAGKTIVSIAAGCYYSLALSSDGRVYAWGTGGALGDNSRENRLLPVDVSTFGALRGKRIVAIATTSTDYNAATSYALDSEGALYAWGHNGTSLQLGNGVHWRSMNESLVPVAVNMSRLVGKRVVAITAGWGNALVRTSDGLLFGWGNNGSGEIDYTASAEIAIPTAVNMSGALSGKRVAQVAMGHNHAIALTTDGVLVGWGSDGGGELGDGPAPSNKVGPVLVATSGVLRGKRIASISADGGHSMAIASDGTLFGWGYNYYGALGRLGLPNAFVPIAINFGALAGQPVQFVSASGSLGFAITGLPAGGTPPVTPPVTPPGGAAGTVSGRVRLSGGAPAAGARVFLVPLATAKVEDVLLSLAGGLPPADVRVTNAGADGAYTFNVSGLRSGQYAVIPVVRGQVMNAMTAPGVPGYPDLGTTISLPLRAGTSVDFTGVRTDSRGADVVIESPRGVEYLGASSVPAPSGSVLDFNSDSRVAPAGGRVVLFTILRLRTDAASLRLPAAQRGIDGVFSRSRGIFVVATGVNSLSADNFFTAPVVGNSWRAPSFPAEVREVLASGSYRLAVTALDKAFNFSLNYSNSTDPNKLPGARYTTQLFSVALKPARLGVTRTLPLVASNGSTFSYVITVSNTGDQPLRNVRVAQNILTDKVTLVPGSPAVSPAPLPGENIVTRVSAFTVEWDLGTLAPHATRILSFRVRAQDSNPFGSNITAGALGATADGFSVRMTRDRINIESSLFLIGNVVNGLRAISDAIGGGLSYAFSSSVRDQRLRDNLDGLTVNSNLTRVSGLDLVQFNLSGALLIPTGGGRVVAVGGANVVAVGGANVVAVGGANVVAVGGANLITIDRTSASSWLSQIITDPARVVAVGGANVVAAGGLNLIHNNGGNLFARGSSVVAVGGANLMDNLSGLASSTALRLANGSSVVAVGGANFTNLNGAGAVAAGGGNVVAAGGGNVVAVGGANVVAVGGANVVAVGGDN